MPHASPKRIARVRIDVPVRHLDRDFDYHIPESLCDDVHVGSRVRVRFARRLVDAYVVAIDDSALVEKTLPIERVIGSTPTLTAATLALVEAVSERYAGTFWDTARSAVPPRHARAEANEFTPCEVPAGHAADPEVWNAYSGGVAAVDRLRAGELTRAVWASAPASSWIHEVNALVQNALTIGNSGVIAVVPDAADLDALAAELTKWLPQECLAVLSTEHSPMRRYRNFLSALHGQARVVIGTRSAIFAPVRDLNLIILWDDGNDTYADPRAPYWDAREVAALRSHMEKCSLFVGSPSRSVATQAWVDNGWAESLEPSGGSRRRPTVRGLRPEDQREDPAADRARIPHAAWQAIKQGLTEGPVLISVARRGYVRAVACASCGTQGRCACGGPLAITSSQNVARCLMCSRAQTQFRCAQCGSSRIAARGIGAQRTAEELGRAFPGVPIVYSEAEHMVRNVSDQPAIVVATPGAEPTCDGGYASVVILDPISGPPRLSIDEDMMRRWFSVAVLARTTGTVFVSIPENDPSVQALLRWDAAGFAARDMAERIEARLPPASRIAVVSGRRQDVSAVTESLTVPHVSMGLVHAPEQAEAKADTWREVLFSPRAHGSAFSHELRVGAARRSADKGAGPITIHVDPRSFE